MTDLDELALLIGDLKDRAGAAALAKHNGTGKRARHAEIAVRVRVIPTFAVLLAKRCPPDLVAAALAGAGRELNALSNDEVAEWAVEAVRRLEGGAG